jgi:demethoxyubiquinone hydroxylase (CLK1/Coq7/Cat5 family)
MAVVTTTTITTIVGAGGARLSQRDSMKTRVVSVENVVLCHVERKLCSVTKNAILVVVVS